MVTLCRGWTEEDGCAGKRLFEADGKWANPVHEQKASLSARTHRDSALTTCTQYTHKYTHTQRVCWWAEGVGEGLGGWYKASLKYKHRATTSEPFQHGWQCCVGKVDPCRTRECCNYLSFSSLMTERMAHDTMRRLNRAAVLFGYRLDMFPYTCVISAASQGKKKHEPVSDDLVTISVFRKIRESLVHSLMCLTAQKKIWAQIR